MKKLLPFAVACAYSCGTFVATAISVKSLESAPGEIVAHEVTKDNESSDSLSVNLHEVSIVVNRATAKTPVAFTNVKREELLQVNDGRDITYLLEGTPSVTVTSDAGAGTGYSSMRIRGIDGSRINVTLNGVPINNPESHNVYWVDLPDLASGVRDVQIQRGAGTSTNGAGAFGASVNMVSESPAQKPFAELSGAYGSYNTHRETLRVGTGLLGGHWSFDARISHLGSDGYIDRATSDLWSYFGQASWRNNCTDIRLIAFGGKEKTYMAWYYASKEEMEKYGRRYNPSGRYIDSDGNIAYYKNQYDNYVQHYFQLLLNQRLGDYWRLNAGLHYTKDDGYYDEYKPDCLLAAYGLKPFIFEGKEISTSDLTRLQYNDNHFGGGTFTLNYERDRWDVTIGGAANYFDGNHFGQVAWVRNFMGAIDPLQQYYKNKGEKTDANIYTRANFDITPGITAFADLQYRYIRYTISGTSDIFDYNTMSRVDPEVDRQWNFFNPKLGVNYASDAHRVFASWSVAHKEPVRDCFIDVHAGDRPEAERLFDYELGYNFNSRIFSAGVNLYFMDYKDQLVTTGQLSDTGNMLTVNVPDSYRMGVEMQAAWRPVQWFEWQANATLSRNRIKNFIEYIYNDNGTDPMTIDCGDTPISFSPGFIFHNSFDFKWRRFTAQLQSRYIGKQYMNNARSEETALDPYFVTDLHLGADFEKIFGIKKLHIGFSVFNLFSAKYFNNGYCGAGYYENEAGEKIIYRYAGYAAQAPIHVSANLTLTF